MSTPPSDAREYPRFNVGDDVVRTSDQALLNVTEVEGDMITAEGWNFILTKEIKTTQHRKHFRAATEREKQRRPIPTPASALIPDEAVITAAANPADAPKTVITEQPIFRPAPGDEPPLEDDDTQEYDPVGALETHLPLPVANELTQLQGDLLEEVMAENTRLADENDKQRKVIAEQRRMLLDVAEEIAEGPAQVEEYFFDGEWNVKTSIDLQKLRNKGWDVAFEQVMIVDMRPVYYARLEREVQIADIAAPEETAETAKVETPTREEAARMILSAQELPAVAASIDHAVASAPERHTQL